MKGTMHLGHWTITRFHWIIGLHVLSIVTQISTEGVFQLQLLSYNNDQQLQKITGTRCTCNDSSKNASSSSSSSSFPSFPSSQSSSASLPAVAASESRPFLCSRSICQASLRVCLSHKVSDNDTQCASATYPPTEESNPKRSSTNTFSFPFNFAWPGMFTVTIEVSYGGNDANMTSHSGRASNENVFRLRTLHTLEVGHDWTHYNYYNQSTTSPAASVSPSLFWLHYAYRAICDDNYYGPKCADSCKIRNDKFGHYFCSENGTRICMSGWKGSYCDTAICLQGCDKKHGLCSEPNECKCRIGWQGQLCNECILYPGCQHGTCEKAWQCNCQEGWGGLFCNQDLMFCAHNRPCRNGSTCLNTGLGSYTCTCQPGFTGKNCDIEIDSCQQLTCLNGATCVASGSSEKCECRRGFRGRQCELPVGLSCSTSSQSPCANGGTCISTPLIGGPEADGSAYRCVCSAGFTGTNCDVNIRECLSNPCQNGGSCIDGRNGYQCLCPPGFDGHQCQTNTNECDINPCLNGGSCIDKINDFECRCLPGFVGFLCQDDVDECLNRPCANGAACSQLVNDFVCFCAPGFAGRYCTDNIDECASSPCRNAGTCHDLISGFECRCADGFIGNFCEHPAGYLPSPVGEYDGEGDDQWMATSEPRVTPTPVVESVLMVTDSSQSQTSVLEGEDDVVAVVRPIQQVLLIVCFGFGIPIVVIASVFLFWIYRKRRHSRTVQRAHLPALNNQRPSRTRPEGAADEMGAAAGVPVVSYDAENCQVSCEYNGFRGKGNGLEPDVDCGNRGDDPDWDGLRRYPSQRGSHRQPPLNSLRNPLGLAGLRGSEWDAAYAAGGAASAGDRGLNGLKKGGRVAEEEGAFDWSARPSTSREVSDLEYNPPVDSPTSFKVPDAHENPRPDFSGHRGCDQVWSIEDRTIAHPSTPSHCAVCHERIMATEV